METVSKIASAAQGMLATDMKPVSAICAHVCAFHFYAEDMNRQVQAHHYCSHGVDGMLQWYVSWTRLASRACHLLACLKELLRSVIYDKNAADAKLIGIEYIIPKSMYETLDAEEQRYWHRYADIADHLCSLLPMPFDKLGRPGIPCT